MERKDQLKAVNRLLDIMDQLREACPWDKKQTFNSLKYLTLEEVYELVDAIDKKENNAIVEELGDLLLHVVFYAKIGSEQQAFDLGVVAQNIADKLVSRHPHVYGDTAATDAKTVQKNWESLKLQEGKKSVLQGVPYSMPSLLKSYRIQEKAAGIGFDWTDSKEVWEKVKEEIEELQEAMEKQNKQETTKEFGDVLFSLVNYARHIGIHPEEALESSNQKFFHRFQYLENNARLAKKPMNQMKSAELEILWKKSKEQFP